MADTNTADNPQGTTGTAQTAAAAQSGERTFSQAEVNRMVGDARQKERAKYAGYVDADELQAAKAEAEKAAKELADLRAATERQQAVSKVADEMGIPTEVVGMLNGANEEELAKQVRRILKVLPAYPVRTDEGGTANVAAAKTNAQRFASMLDGVL
jgi:hypothetical protein